MSDQVSLAPGLFAPLPLQKLASLAATTSSLATSAAMPLAAHVTATGGEMAALASRRSAAWLNHSRTLASSREPNAWMAASQAFWQQAFADYAESSQKMMASWTKAAQRAAQGLQPLAAAVANGGSPLAATRDYITFKEPEPQVETPVRKPDSRRAAA